MALDQYLLMPLTRHGHQALLSRVLGLRSNFSAYDACYVALAERLGVERLVDESAVDRLAGHGLLERDGATLRTTAAGRLVLDSILAEIAS